VALTSRTSVLYSSYSPDCREVVLPEVPIRDHAKPQSYRARNTP
jgi:hypothetical protein